MDWISFFTSIGRISIEYVWIPLGIWTIAALPLFFLSRLVSNRQPVIHYQACIVLLLSLPLGFLFMPFASVDVPSAEFQQNISIYIDSYIPVAPSTTVKQVAPQAIPLTSEVVSTVTFSAVTWIGLLSAVAALLSLWFFIRLLLNISLIRSTYSYLSPVTTPETLSILGSLTRSMGIKREVQLLLDSSGTIPCTLGWTKPIVVIPEGIEHDHHTLRTTLLHELTHIRRNDYLWGVVTQFLAALFIYHPFVHILCRDLNTYRELSCDSELIQLRAVDPAAYARLLLRFSISSQSPLSIKIKQPKSDLKKRISSMQRYSHYKPATSIVILPMVLLIPTLFLSCSVGKNGQEENNPNEINLSDIGMTFNLPKGWVVGKQTRVTPKSSYESSLEDFPADINPVYHSILKKRKPWWRPNRLVWGTNFFVSSNLSDVLSDDFTAVHPPFYKFDLRITYDDQRRRSKENLELWREGKCKRAGEIYYCKDPKDWQVNTNNYKRIRQLDKSEIPFDADSGFLYESNFQYGPEDGMHTRWLIYHFFTVKGKKTYHIMLTGISLHSDKSDYTESGTLLSENSIAEMMASIRFH